MTELFPWRDEFLDTDADSLEKTYYEEAPWQLFIEQEDMLSYGPGMGSESLGVFEYALTSDMEADEGQACWSQSWEWYQPSFEIPEPSKCGSALSGGVSLERSSFKSDPNQYCPIPRKKRAETPFNSSTTAGLDATLYILPDGDDGLMSGEQPLAEQGQESGEEKNRRAWRRINWKDSYDIHSEFFSSSDDVKSISRPEKSLFFDSKKKSARSSGAATKNKYSREFENTAAADDNDDDQWSETEIQLFEQALARFGTSDTQLISIHVATKTMSQVESLLSQYHASANFTDEASAVTDSTVRTKWPPSSLAKNGKKQQHYEHHTLGHACSVTKPRRTISTSKKVSPLSANRRFPSRGRSCKRSVKTPTLGEHFSDATVVEGEQYIILLKTGDGDEDVKIDDESDQNF